jgi:hypothetical protein
MTDHRIQKTARDESFDPELTTEGLRAEGLPSAFPGPELVEARIDGYL